MKMNNPKKDTIEIYVQLQADEEGTLRPTQAIPLEGGLYKVLPIPNFDKVGEVWEFFPGSIVRVEERSYRGRKFLLAVEQVS